MTGQVDLSITDNSSVEDNTIIYRALSGNGLSQYDTQGANTTSYSDTGVVDARTYDYAVSMSNAAGESSLSATDSISIPLSAPSSLSVTQGTNDGELDLDWTRNDDNPNGEWQIYRDGTQVDTISNPSTTTYTDTGLDDNTQYNYFVRRSVNGETADTSTQSGTTAIGTPSSPQNVVATVDSATQITITWDPPSDWGRDQDGYRVYRGTVSGTYSQIADYGTTTTQHVDSGLLNGERYFYVVTAYNSAGESADSTEDSGTTPLPNPTNINAEAQL